MEYRKIEGRHLFDQLGAFLGGPRGLVCLRLFEKRAFSFFSIPLFHCFGPSGDPMVFHSPSPTLVDPHSPTGPIWSNFLLSTIRLETGNS